MSHKGSSVNCSGSVPTRSGPTEVDYLCSSCGQMHPLHLSHWEACVIELRLALEASVQLQAHYARLLNQHDGGERRVFASADEWLARMREMKQEEDNDAQ